MKVHAYLAATEGLMERVGRVSPIQRPFSLLGIEGVREKSLQANPIRTSDKLIKMKIK
jgi:hypothetical protein